MPFRESWILIGGILIVIGYTLAMPTMAGVGFVIFVIGGVSRYWSRHLFDRVSFTRRLNVSRVFIDEPAEYQRIQAFELQYFDGNAWKSFYSGKTVGPEWSAVIEPVLVGRRVRLNVLKSTDGPTIREFQLYGQSCPKSATSSN